MILKHCDSLPLLQHVLCYNDCNTAPSEQTGLCCSGGVFHHTDYSVNNFASALEREKSETCMYEACALVIACHSRSDCGTVQRDVNRKNTEGWGRE